MKIKTLTIVTAQGVREYHSSKDSDIIESDYSICGDPYPCYQVIEENEVVSEIRCIHNVTIDFEHEEEVVEEKPEPGKYICLECGKDMGSIISTCPHCHFENPF